MQNSEDIIKQLEKKLANFSNDTFSKNVGIVEKNTDRNKQYAKHQISFCST